MSKRVERLRALVALRTLAQADCCDHERLGVTNDDLTRGLAILDGEIDEEMRAVAVEMLTEERVLDIGSTVYNARQWAHVRVREHPEEIADAVRRAGA